MSAGLFTDRGMGRSAAEVEEAIARSLGLPSPGTPAGPAPYSGDAPAAPVAAAPLIGGVDVNRGIAFTGIGQLQLSRTANGIIVGIISQAMQDHLAAQLAALNTQLGVPNAAALATVAQSALSRAAAAGAPPLPNLDVLTDEDEAE